jgi:soluble lytic murein transglycosylase
MALAALLVTTLSLAAAAPIAELRRGHQEFQAGRYEKAARVLAPLASRLPRVRDYVLYLAAESEFYAGRPAAARAWWSELLEEADSRFAPLAPWRIADCLWAEGRKTEAATAYRRLIDKPPAGVDPVVARFRLADLEAPAEAAGLFRQIHAEHPAHPLAAEAARRAPPGAAGDEGGADDPRTRLRRAARLVQGRRIEEAIAELEAIPRDLPAELKAERDFDLGMAKFRTRHDYLAASALLLDVAPRLEGERSAFAAFHGARALARAGRIDQAIDAAAAVVKRFPGSRWGAEAQFFAGWLEFNRGRYRESVAGLQRTFDRYRKSAFADDAAWYLALAYYFLRRYDEALASLGDHARLVGSDPDAVRRVSYWRGRFLWSKGNSAEGRKAWRDLVKDQPLSYYGLLARARLRQARETVRLRWPATDFKLPELARQARRDPAVLRADELAAAGLVTEAGIELQRSEGALDERLGRAQATTLLFERYGRCGAFRRGYQLADARGGEALQSAPRGSGRIIWEAFYPRAYRSAVERQARAARVPPLFVYAIMHKESGFGPTVTSPADARGLLQLLPSLGAELSAKLRRPFVPEDLFRPEVNIALGVRRLGSLLEMFDRQLFLAAGAYNGGIVAVKRWLDQHGQRPLDEFLELVGVNESREYMKRVTALHARYTYLYTGKVPELSLKVKTSKRNRARPGPKEKAEPATPPVPAPGDEPSPSEPIDPSP